MKQLTNTVVWILAIIGVILQLIPLGFTGTALCIGWIGEKISKLFNYVIVLAEYLAMKNN